MAHRPTLVMIGGGLGKTTVALALVDYLKKNRIHPMVYDATPEPGVLHKFLPDSKCVDIATTASGNPPPDRQQVLGDVTNRISILDLRAGSLSYLLTRLVHEGWLNLPRKRLILLHVLGNTRAYLQEVAATELILGAVGAEHWLIKNHAVEDVRRQYEWDRDFYDAKFQELAIPILDLPHLSRMATEEMKNRCAGFSIYIADKTNPLWTRDLVRAWLHHTWLEFDRIALTRKA